MESSANVPKHRQVVMPSEYLANQPQGKPQINPQGVANSCNWVYINGLGERDQKNVSKNDLLTAIRYDKTGKYLAVGDQGGRVIIFKYNELKNSRYFDYRYFTEIQSHEPEFDHLKSIELDEKINAIEFVNNKQSALQMLSTNDRIIKLWKFDYKVHKEFSKCSIGPGGELVLPKNTSVEEGYEPVERKQFKFCHNYNINTMSVSPDGENFLSADELRVNLWSLENNILAFNLVDLKPANIEELAEVITHVEYHPRRSDVFLLSSSKGYISLCDLRVNSQFNRCSTKFMVEEDPSRKHFFTDIINSISRAKFSPIDDRYIYSRDYLGVQIWDIRNQRQPCKVMNVTDYLEKKLCEVYESENIFDKFDL
jgi:serine/threonine-protein phosphatase 2A regulatory subunit B